MIPNIHQSIDEIIRAASPVEKLMWQQIRLLTGERAAIRQLHYCGTITGSEFVTHSPNKLYLGLEVDFGPDATPRAAAPLIAFYNEANAIFKQDANNSTYWDTTAAAMKYVPNSFSLNNVLFWRVTTTANYYNFIAFKGYRINY